MNKKKTFKYLRALLREWEWQSQGKDIEDIRHDLNRVASQIQSEIDSIHHERITRANELLNKIL